MEKLVYKGPCDGIFGQRSYGMNQFKEFMALCMPKARLIFQERRHSGITLEYLSQSNVTVRYELDRKSARLKLRSLDRSALGGIEQKLLELIDAKKIIGRAMREINLDRVASSTIQAIEKEAGKPLTRKERRMVRNYFTERKQATKPYPVE